MTFIMAVLGSSVGAAIVTAIFHIWNSMRQSELQIVQDQLRGLYGPLFYFTCSNEAFIVLYNKYHLMYSKEYKGNNIAPESIDAYREEALAMLEEANSYINIEVIHNNEQINKLLEEQWHLIDYDDVKIFSQFQIDMARLKRTRDQTLRTAIITKEHIGSVSYMRPEMIKMVKAKWKLKRKRVEQLTKGWRILF